jgi:serine/threonine protein kinase
MDGNSNSGLLAFSSDEKFGDYLIHEKLGGNGSVSFTYKAKHIPTKKWVALKIFSLAPNDLVKVSFDSELRIKELKSFPGIIELQSFGEVNGIYYIATPFMEDGSLRDLLQRSGGCLEMDDTLRLFFSIAVAIDFCHKESIVHRDLKPENILLRKTEKGYEPFLSDFGTAKILDKAGYYQTMTVSGTANYIAPEAWSYDDKVKKTGAVDIYALGVMLYEVLEGKLPFSSIAHDHLLIMKQHQSEPAPYPKQIAEKTNPDVAKVILRALEKDPQKRPATAQELISELSQAFIGDEAAPWIGRKIGKYLVRGVLGQGPTSVTLKARDTTKKDDWVVLKVFQTASFWGRARQAFEDEMAALCKLDKHSGILISRDCGEQNGLYYIATDYIAGGNLRQYLDKYPNGLGLKDIVILFSKIAEAVDYVHSQNIVHRDLKPENVVLESEDKGTEPYLTDFGIAKIMAGTQSFYTQTVRGTFQYMPPEAWHPGQPQTPAVDIYAFGTMLYEAIEGTVPFRAEYPAIINQHLTAEPPVPPRALREFGQEWVDILLETLAKDPAKRPESAADIMEQLRLRCPGIEFIGEQIGEHYQVESYLGGSSIGLTFKAQDLRTKDWVALKLLQSNSFSLKEIEIFQNLGNQPGILSLRDRGRDKRRGMFYLVTDFQDGGNLRKLLNSHPNGMEIEAVFDLFEPLAQAIDKLHDFHVAHRDLKPENVVLRKLDQGYETFITDFGISRTLNNTHSFITTTFAGTSHYMAPEAWADTHQTTAVDIYAFGVMLYEAFEGQPPFQAEYPAIGYKHLMEDVPPPNALLEKAGVTAAGVLLRALAKKPEQRPATAGEIVKSIRKAYQYHQALQNIQSMEGTLYHDYQVEQLLETSPVSATFRAVDMHNGEVVALQVFPGIDLFPLAPRAFEEFSRDIEQVKEIPTGVLRYRQVKSEDDAYFLTTDFPKGKTLRHFIQENSNGLKFDDVMEWLRPIAQTLDDLHSKNIVHGNLRPEHIVLWETESGYEPRLKDIGVYKIHDAINEELRLLASPPDNDRTVSQKHYTDDTSALGIIMVEMLEGKFYETL